MNEIREDNYDVNVLWKENISYLWVLKNDFVSMIVSTLILVDNETGCVVKLISLPFHTYEEHPNWRSYMSCASI
jgi:hypothetical protein